jgi:diguanylate cyclase (GGDEF)-like protein
VFHDVTDQRHIESELAELALHDPLTGLANRLLLTDRLQVAFDRASRDGGSVGVVFLDLDDFKRVNDTLGHDAGDELLVETAERLRHAVRPADTVARLGGDEFVVVCSLGSASELLHVQDRLGWALRQPYHLRGRVVRVGASIGIATTADFDADPGGLLQDADAAMYREKRARRRG